MVSEPLPPFSKDCQVLYLETESKELSASETRTKQIGTKPWEIYDEYRFPKSLDSFQMKQHLCVCPHGWRDCSSLALLIFARLHDRHCPRHTCPVDPITELRILLAIREG